jgi:3',5'-cyclic AMP phosphodiesterase CpdA
MSGPIIAQTTGMMLKEVQEEREGWEVLWSKTGIMGFQERTADNGTCYINLLIASRRLWNAEHAWGGCRAHARSNHVP